MPLLKITFFAVSKLLLATVGSAQVDTSKCNALTVDLVLLESDSSQKVIEDEIREDLDKVGITVKTKFLDRDEYGEVMVNGTFNMFFSETWGAPYDPHSYAMSWGVPSNSHYAALSNLTPPLSREALIQEITDVQTELDEATRTAKWTAILNDVHSQAVDLPLYGKRTPYVVNRRLAGFVPSGQAYDYPLTGVHVVYGPAKVTVSPGTTAGMFQSVGALNPHQYFPNELFSTDWVYEGLVEYGRDGEIVPALATSWNTVARGEGQRVTFQLRQNVTFHDGSEWNCSVAKLNFDHVLGETVRERHMWFGLTQHVNNWYCDGNGRFVLETSSPYYPLLQELSYIRPLAMAATTSFANGLDSSPITENSCEPGMFGPDKWDFIEETITCRGINPPVGTGPFRFVRRERLDDETDSSVLFARHEDYWGGAPNIEELEVKFYETNQNVKDALLSGDLDMALGNGPLSPQDIEDFKLEHKEHFHTLHSDVIQNAVIVLNTGKAPTSDINVRKVIMAAVNKAPMIKKEFKLLAKPVSQLFPLAAPYCDVDLTPRWDYDLEKAALLNCGEGSVADGNVKAVPLSDSAAVSGGDSNAALIGGVVAAVVAALALAGLVAFMILRERQGKPIFTRVSDGDPV